VTVDALSHFREIWCGDTEFHAPHGGPQEPICFAARELRSGQVVQRWLWDEPCHLPPLPADEETLFVAYLASAELGVYLACGWPMPKRICDPYAEFRLLTSGRPAPCGNSLLGALAAFGLPCMEAPAKEAMRAVAIRGGPFSARERDGLLAYCQEDADALAKLLPAMLPYIDMPRALLRGRYMMAVARMEAVGVPLDTEALARLRDSWGAIQSRLIERIDADFAVYDGTHFSRAAFERYLARHGIPWPRLPSGALELSEEAFGEMALAYARLKPLHDLRVSLAQLREWKLQVGSDGRNRVLLSPFASKTGRNQPSNAKFIFGPAVWLRSLIRPEPGTALAYVDWSGQEYGIAAALSGDGAMQRDYQSGDPYLAFAKRAGAVPPDATKKTHARERELFKVCCGLAAMYGMGPESLARRICQPVAVARELLELHHRSYPTFWRWLDTVQDFAMLHGYLQTVFGWRVHVQPNTSPGSLRNFSMQANGAEMLRLACCLATERGIRVCAPIHDALLIEAPAEEIDAVAGATQAAMREASELVLPGFPLRTEANVLRPGQRYRDERGAAMWETVWQLLGSADPWQICHPYPWQDCHPTPCRAATPVQSYLSPLFYSCSSKERCTPCQP
jgi:hypothetical protein